MKQEDIVILTKSFNGIEINSVGIVKSINQTEARVYFVGKNKEVITPIDYLSAICVKKTKPQDIFYKLIEIDKKICPICHVIKSVKNREFDDVIRGCKNCRKKIRGNDMTAAEKRKMNEKRPSDKSFFTCSICQRREIVGVTVQIHLDHDRKTGKGRQWLCSSCNTGLGRFKDDIKILERAIAYLQGFEDKID